MSLKKTLLFTTDVEEETSRKRQREEAPQDQDKVAEEEEDDEKDEEDPFLDKEEEQEARTDEESHSSDVGSDFSEAERCYLEDSEAEEEAPIVTVPHFREVNNDWVSVARASKAGDLLKLSFNFKDKTKGTLLCVFMNIGSKLETKALLIPRALWLELWFQGFITRSLMLKIPTDLAACTGAEKVTIE